MGETSVYYVPVSDAALVGRSDELIEICWDRGLFLATRDNRIYDRIREWRQQGRELPAWGHSFGFASMGLVEAPLYDPVPNMPYEVCCPRCKGDLLDSAIDAWQAEGDTRPIPERPVTCPACGATPRSAELASQSASFEFARVYFWVADIGDDWDPSFRHTIEAILGPCREYTAWET